MLCCQSLGEAEYEVGETDPSYSLLILLFLLLLRFALLGLLDVMSAFRSHYFLRLELMFLDNISYAITFFTPMHSEYGHTHTVMSSSLLTL